MKILYVTPIAPSTFSGGAIVVKQSVDALLKFASIDYVGPKLDKTYKSLMESVFIINSNHSFSALIKTAVFRANTTRFFDWRKFSKNIDWKKYGAVYLEFSKFGFVAKTAKRNNKKLIVRLHNVETDLMKNLFKKGRKFLELYNLFSLKKQEREVINLADIIIPLTEHDKNMLMKIYSSCQTKKFYVVPVCLDNKNESSIKKKSCNGFTLLITGSLWYGPNHEGILWFIKNVFSCLDEEFKLIIAGSNPSKKLEKIVRENNKINLAKDPENISKFFQEADIYIAPIFYGGGMKVKVAEAFSYGLPVVGTKHAFIGYRHEENPGCYIAETKATFKKQLSSVSINLKNYEKEFRRKILIYFQSHFSKGANFKYFSQILRSIKNEGSYYNS